MSFDINLKGKEQKIKFNYTLIFKANKKLATKDKEGNPQNDGAGVLFVQVLEKEDDALVNLLQLVDSKATENDALEAIGMYVQELIESGLSEEEAYNRIFEDLKQEMLASGFFVSKIRKYLENIEKVIEVMVSRKKEEDKIQITQLKELSERIKKEIS